MNQQLLHHREHPRRQIRPLLNYVLLVKQDSGFEPKYTVYANVVCTENCRMFAVVPPLLIQMRNSSSRLY